MKSEDSYGPQETDSVMEKYVSCHWAGRGAWTARTEVPGDTASLTFLTLPLPPAPFPCAPPLSWLTCPGAALGLPGWPGPAPARGRKERREQGDGGGGWGGLLRGMVEHTDANQPGLHLRQTWFYCFEEAGTWNGLIFILEKLLIPPSFHFPGFSNKDACKGNVQTLKPSLVLAWDLEEILGPRIIKRAAAMGTHSQQSEARETAL